MSEDESLVQEQVANSDVFKKDFKALVDKAVAGQEEGKTADPVFLNLKEKSDYLKNYLIGEIWHDLKHLVVDIDNGKEQNLEVVEAKAKEIQTKLSELNKTLHTATVDHSGKTKQNIRREDLSEDEYSANITLVGWFGNLVSGFAHAQAFGNVDEFKVEFLNEIKKEMGL